MLPLASSGRTPAWSTGVPRPTLPPGSASQTRERWALQFSAPPSRISHRPKSRSTAGHPLIETPKESKTWMPPPVGTAGLQYGARPVLRAGDCLDHFQSFATRMLTFLCLTGDFLCEIPYPKCASRNYVRYSWVQHLPAFHELLQRQAETENALRRAIDRLIVEWVGAVN
jgi:hypothetical protein